MKNSNTLSLIAVLLLTSCIGGTKLSQRILFRMLCSVLRMCRTVPVPKRGGFMGKQKQQKRELPLILKHSNGLESVAWFIMTRHTVGWRSFSRFFS